MRRNISASAPSRTRIPQPPSSVPMSIPLLSGSARRALLPLLLFACVATAHAQVNVTLNIKRRIFVANEPVIATVTIVNNTGRDIMLADTEEGKQWFSFQING